MLFLWYFTIKCYTTPLHSSLSAVFLTRLQPRKFKMYLTRFLLIYLGRNCEKSLRGPWTSTLPNKESLTFCEFLRVVSWKSPRSRWFSNKSLYHSFLQIGEESMEILGRRHSTCSEILFVPLKPVQGWGRGARSYW